MAANGALQRPWPLAVLASAAVLSFGSPAPLRAQATTDRFIVTVDKTADFAAARAALLGSGAEIITEIPELNLMVVQRGAAAAATMAAVPGVSGTIPDRITRISPPEGQKPNSRHPDCARPAWCQCRLRRRPRAASSRIRLRLQGLLWDYRRIGLPEGWKESAGRPAVTVGVADTGVDFTHADLKPSIVHVEGFHPQ